ncbi:MAG: hypothetical protein KF803_11285 [Cyclobacteriaceae bacterium]|nr:hypothetical protein [Cyclobacteriaceae bacterium]
MSLRLEDLSSQIQEYKEDILQKSDGRFSTIDPVRWFLRKLVHLREKSLSSNFVIIITDDDLKNLRPDVADKGLEQLLHRLKFKNTFVVKNDLCIHSEEHKLYTDSVAARLDCKAKSINNKWVFLLSKAGWGIWNNQIEDSNTTFLADSDIKLYEKKRDISDIEEVMKEYQEHLKHHKNVIAFFVDKFSVQRLNHGKRKHIKNILKNKPENDLRNNLLDFLASKIDRGFNMSKENELDSERRMDINTEDNDGNYYFFEVKWLGRCVNHDGTKINSGFGESSIKQGYNQAMKYIQELMASNKTVKMGGLIIFDAREKKKDFSKYFNDRYLDPGLMKFKPLFAKWDQLHIDNVTPK